MLPKTAILSNWQPANETAAPTTAGCWYTSNYENRIRVKNHAGSDVFLSKINHRGTISK